MNNEDQARILTRIRKMMRLAEDAGATEGERDNAMRMVHATLAKYNLDMASVGELDEQTRKDKDEPREKIDEVFYGRPWAKQVCNAIAKLYFCHYFFMGKGRMTKHNFVGRHSNAVTAKEMSKFLVVAIHREATRYAKENFGGSEMRRSFGMGAADKIFQRCREILDAANKQQAAPGTALVLANVYAIEAKANKDYLKSLGINLVSGAQGKKTVSVMAHEAGQRYGASVSLQNQVGSGGSNNQRRLK